MTFTYNPTLPNPPNDPADDVSGMQINSASISGLVAVDHQGFNVAGGGQHKQITFNANNIPGAFPVNPPVLFTNNPGIAPLNYPQLFYFSGTAAQSSNQYVAAASGSTMLLGGIILKWGTLTLPVAPTPVAFASAFPNNCYSVVAQVITASNSNANLVHISNITTAGFTAVGGAGFITYTFSYIAIGN